MGRAEGDSGAKLIGQVGPKGGTHLLTYLLTWYRAYKFVSPIMAPFDYMRIGAPSSVAAAGSASLLAPGPFRALLPRMMKLRWFATGRSGWGVVIAAPSIFFLLEKCKRRYTDALHAEDRSLLQGSKREASV